VLKPIGFGGTLRAGYPRCYSTVMQAAEHFLSELAALQRSYNLSLDEQTLDRLFRSFSRLVAPVVGLPVAEDLFAGWQRRFGSQAGSNLAVLGYIAAYVLDEYDPAGMPLDAETWSDILDAVHLGADTMDLDTLTRLMGDLLARGALK